MSEAVLEHDVEAAEAAAPEAPAEEEGRRCVDVCFARGWLTQDRSNRPGWRRLRLPGFTLPGGVDLSKSRVSWVFEDVRNDRVYVRFVGNLPEECAWADGAEAPTARPRLDPKLPGRVLDVREATGEVIERGS